MILKHIPNTLTFFRLVLIVPFLLFLQQQQYVYAFYLFIIAGLTDGLDGWLARHFNWQTTFGSMIDPLADKLLVVCSFIALALTESLPWWLVALVILRDLTITLGVLAWYLLVQRRMDFEPTQLSKFNTTFQLSLITLCLFELAYFRFPPFILYTLILLTAITTSASFIDYVWTWGNKAWSKQRQN